MTLRFTKGHGTQNDFVLLLDPDGTLELDEERVRALADRRAGIGGDGVIRVVRTEHSGEPSVVGQDAEWFMDYRNADGSIAEMCGNGTRVFAQLLVREGLAGGESFSIATRAGVKTVRALAPVDGLPRYAVNLGPWRVPDLAVAQERGFDAVVKLEAGPELPGLTLDLGNPHTVVALPEEIALDEVDLTVAPHVVPTPARGTNVEVVRVLGPGHLAMRVHERGVGETRSCGTGAAAAALAVRFWENATDTDRVWSVDVPGGRLGVQALPDGTVELSGPAVLVADGETTL